MNRLKKVSLIIGLVAVFIMVAITISKVNAISEDQSFICKQNNHVGNQFDKTIVCTLVNDDNVFTKSGSETIMNQFKYELDVFDSIYLGEID